MLSEQFIARENTVSTKTWEYAGTSKDARIEVLEKKIEVDSKNHESEKEKLTIEKNHAIGNLEAENENLKIELATHKDKVKQLDIANDKKTFLLKRREHDVKELRNDIEYLRKGKDEFQAQISQLEEEKKHLKENIQELLKTVQGKEEEIKSMKIRISSLEKDIELLREEKMEQERKILDQMKTIESKIADIDIDARAREIERDLEMKVLLKQQEDDAKRRDRLHREYLDKIYGEVINSKKEIIRDIKETATIPENFVITEARNLQVHKGDRFYIQQDRQFGVSSRVRLPPPVELSLKASMNGFQNRRGYCPSYKTPTYKK